MRHVHSTVVGIALFIQLFLPANLGLAQAGQETTRQQATTGKPTGVDLLNACEAYARFNSKAPNLTTDDLVGAMACLSYVNGFHDASMTMQILYQGHFQAFAVSDAYICYPSNGTTGEQLALIVLKFLRDHPERLNEPEFNLVFDSLRQAFPCK